MWKAAVTGFYLQSLQWRLLKSRQPRSLSAPSCFDHENNIGGKSCTKLTYDATKTGQRLINVRRNEDWTTTNFNV